MPPARRAAGALESGDDQSDKPRTRFVVRDIEVENFKSYAGVHRIGPFHKTFTCVIGPNGSGKSNVIDAMLFVFGRSAKKIRLEKLAELIHNSAAFPDLAYASVTVNFIEVRDTDEDAVDYNQRLEISGTELSVKREVHRNNVSQYFLNNVRCTQKDVQQTLTQKGVDLDHNRFLILQGEVEQISMMKPKAEKEGEEGLLEYLDDLIGTSHYAQSISEATVGVEKAQEDRLNALDDLRRIEADRAALTAAKSTAIDYVRKDNNLQSILIVLCQKKTAEIEASLVEPRKRLEELKGQMDSILGSIAEKNALVAKCKKEEAKLKAALDAVCKERDAARARKISCEVDLENEKASIEEQEKQRKKEGDRIKKLKEELNQMQTQQQAAVLDVQVKERNFEEAKAMVATLQPLFDAKSEELARVQQPLRVELERLNKILLPYAKRVEEATENNKDASDRLKREEDKVVRAEEALHKNVQETARLRQSIADLQEMLRRAENVELAQQITRCREQLKSCVAAKLNVNQSIEECKRQFRETNADDRIADFLLGQRDLKGYYGTLRQLGSIADQYDVAAGMASNHWGHLVVEDADAATTVLQRLKEHGKGRATVVILKEVSRRVSERIDRKFTAPEGSVRLFDLIKPVNERFLPAFFNAVQDTLVASNLTEARRIAFGGSARHRVVTMKGELVEPNGSMSGGGQPRAAKLKAARSPQDNAQVKAQLSALQQELEQAIRREADVREELELLERQQQSTASVEQLRKMKQQLVSLQAALQRCADQEPQLTAALEALQQGKGNKELHASLRRAVDEAARLLEVALKEQAQHKASVDECRQQLANAESEDYMSLKQSIGDAKRRVGTDESSLREANKALQRIKTSYERKEKDLVEATSRLATLQDDQAEHRKAELVRLVHLVDVASKELLGFETRVYEAEAAVEQSREGQEVIVAEIREHSKAHDQKKADHATHESTISTELQHLGRLAEKLQRSEEHIRENIRTYGSETFDAVKESRELPRGSGADESDSAEDDGQHHRGRREKRKRDDHDDDEDDEEGGDVDDRKKGDDDPDASGAGSVVRQSATYEDDEEPPRQMTDEEIAGLVLTVPQEQLCQYDYQHSSHLARNLAEELKRIEPTIDVSAVARWREKDALYRQSKAKYDGIRQHLEKLESDLNDLKNARKTEFLGCFAIIQRQVKEMYQMLTHGGDAEVELLDGQDPFEGVNFLVRPPKKSWKQVSNLSGGEKTLASLALVFALHHVRPTPIYVMDEIDAALDFRNVSIVANYVLRQASGAQFIIISLRNNMFELAHQLVGICKVRDVTRSLTLNPRAMERVIQEMHMNLRKRARAAGT